MKLDLLPDGDLMEYVCENERDKPHLVGRSGDEFQVPASILARYVGTYGAAPFPEVVTLESGQLMLDAGAGKIPLIAHSQTTFTLEGTGVEFVTDAAGKVTGMIQHWNEGDRNFPRSR